MKIMSPEKKLAKSWPFGEMKTRNTLLDKRFRVSGYHSNSMVATDFSETIYQNDRRSFS